MANTRQPSTHPADNLFQRVFAAALGTLLGLSLLKLGNPVLMDSEVGIPGNAFEWVLTGWPLVVGHGLLLLVCVLGLFVARKRPELPGWLAFAPLPWLGWQWVAAAGSTHTTRDSVVVFNEIHYHPAGDNSALEYVELYNQLAVDVDLSNWRKV